MNEPIVKEPLVVILMGSKADAPHGQKIADAARGFGLKVVTRIGSAHKTPEHVLALLREYEADPRAKVYVTIAGRSNALSGFVDGAVTAPVIACPPPSDAFGGMDLLSSLRMPSAIASAVVLDPANAALLAAKILGLTNPAVRERVRAFQKEQARKILDDDNTEQANDK
jgi:5-(carboxyamino)imidazole ribonucleotide mutase/phosphoribosylaminoimidazole-succinocarboxamide synthase